MYIHIDTKEYPLSELDIRERHPNTMFGMPFIPTEHYVPVEPSDTPRYDPDTQKPIEIEPIEIEGVWRQQWAVVPLSAEELAALQRQREAEAAALIPKSCTRRQGRLALLAYGLLDDAETAIAAITDAAAKREAQIEYEADTWERSNPFLASLWTQLGGTPQSLDEAFALAVTL